ncbi:MAG: GNAT family N-acetyltransferase, partial [Sandaracinaceae bacterium]|nr:GNAT family N-acetyltransferase [Sandaracinaceae bacterium]
MHRIRDARLDEAPLLQDIEDDAGRRYGEVGIPEDLEGLARAVVEAAIREGTTWVATDDDDAPIGFALCWVRKDALHLRELDVRQAHMRRGIGRRLLEHVAERA